MLVTSDIAYRPISIGYVIAYLFEGFLLTKLSVVVDVFSS